MQGEGKIVARARSAQPDDAVHHDDEAIELQAGQMITLGNHSLICHTVGGSQRSIEEDARMAALAGEQRQRDDEPRHGVADLA